MVRGVGRDGASASRTRAEPGQPGQRSLLYPRAHGKHDGTCEDYFIILLPGPDLTWQENARAKQWAAGHLASARPRPTSPARRRAWGAHPEKMRSGALFMITF